MRFAVADSFIRCSEKVKLQRGSQANEGANKYMIIFHHTFSSNFIAKFELKKDMDTDFYSDNFNGMF